MGRQRSERQHVTGPTKDHRVILVGADGKRRFRRFETAEQAREFAEIARAQANRATEKTVEEALEDYLLYQKLKGNKPQTIDTTEYRLRGLLGPVLEKRAAAITEARAKALYLELSRKQKPDTHRNALKQAKSFGRWMIAEKLSPRNPFEGIEPLGALSKGKPQLRIDEARRWLRAALVMAKDGEAGAVAAALALLLGLRAGEIVGRQVRDLDDGGRLVWVDGTKTRSSRRTLEVPEVLREYLQREAQGKKSEERLFPFDVDWVRRWTVRVCAAAGVLRVCAHSMRGLHASLATAAGITSHVVAGALGHSSPAVTEAHYTSPVALAVARQARALELLPGGKTSQGKG